MFVLTDTVNGISLYDMVVLLIYVSHYSILVLILEVIILDLNFFVVKEI